MAEINSVIADPISSDGSEESWILLDEMDEAMKEEFSTSKMSEVDQGNTVTGSTSTGTKTQSSVIEMAREPVPEICVTEDDDPSNIETIGSEICPSNDEDDDDINDSANLRRILEKSITLQPYDDSNDGFTTDGSNSMLCDDEIEQNCFESNDLALNAQSSSVQPQQMWMRCMPIDMSVCTKRPIAVRPRNHCDQPTSVNGLGLAPQNIIEDIFHCLDRLNNFWSSIYLLQVLLLFLTAGSVTLLVIVYSRYSACKLEVKDLEQKLYSAKVENIQIEGSLVRCQYLYELELDKTAKTSNGGFEIEKDDKEMPAVHNEANDANDEYKIQPTRLFDESDNMDDISSLEDYGLNVWTGDGDKINTKKLFGNTKKNYLAECDDESSLFSEYNREHCESIKSHDDDSTTQLPEKVYSTHYSYKPIDTQECNPNKIDFSLGFEHAQNVLRDSNCDDKGTMNYLHQVYEHYLRKTNRNNLKAQKSIEKWDKTKHNVKNVDKYDENVSEKRLDRGDKKDHRDKKQKHRKDSGKENKRKNDRKDTKKYHQDRTQGKWNKNDHRRDMDKVYDHRHDD